MEELEQHSSSEFNENLAILREIRFFSGFPLEMLKILAYLCTRENFKAGDYLFRQNDDDGLAFFIISGKAQLTHNKETLILRDIEKGTFMGSLALLGTAPRIFSLKALTDISCMIMSREKFAKAIEQFPDQIPRILKTVSENVHTWEQRFLSESGESCENCFKQLGVSLI
jgi:CRP-like cAMP-binding protein